ncbi:nickel ABC transporter, periplasmic nickel-binding protein [Nitzschia inconspicua]|uniref:Nickel ABC transporter, periplasmic nickel-binding protein n=1 Tax=Nitzschia inconspicua TaxID=303405 RepID=A0A9K3KMS6_9STRA|nr:nickel ABC transporter, periplasmic nickel-binding protein [Nitzschia inconspicua]
MRRLAVSFIAFHWAQANISHEEQGGLGTNIDQAALDAAIACNKKYGTLKFLVLENEAVNAAVEDDIRRDLAKVGFTVKAETLSKEAINEARQSGNFHFSLTETWGTPYDPYSFASGWIDGLGGEGVFPAMENFVPPSSRQDLFDLVHEVLQEEKPLLLKQKWAKIHNYYHAQAVMLPLWGKRIPTLLNSRLTGYQAGYQQFDYPVHKLAPVTGPTTVTIAPGAQTGMFQTVGYLDAHTYGPNEFFSSNWVYEGLVSYGIGGQILPSLATAWTVESNNIGGDTYTFMLREGVKFHDGTPWDCAAAKLNFDYILNGELRSRHGWYGVPLYIEDWTCKDDINFVLRTNLKHGPFLQELTFIRPIRMISPAAFINGNSTDPTSHNSCRVDWGIIDGNDFSEDVVCAGINGIYGTGPFAYDSRETVTITTSEGEQKEVDDEVVFTAFEDYWGGAPAIKRLEVKRYQTSEEVKTALLSGELDVVWGSGVLSDSDIFDIENDVELQGKIKTIIHAINKAAFVEQELKGLQQVVDNVFPLEAPFCDVDLTPRWDYDLEKAILLSCVKEEGGIFTVATETKDDDDNNPLALALGLGLGFPLLAVIAFAASFYHKSKKFEEELNLRKKEGAVDA